MKKTIIFGVNERAVQYVLNHQDEDIAVVDVKNFLRRPKYVFFKDDITQLFYHSAQVRKSLMSHSFKESQDFFRQISSSHHEKEKELKQLLLNQLKRLNVDIYRGHVSFNGENQVTLRYLDNVDVLSYDQAFLNAGYYEKHDREHAFVFTLDELIHGEHLYESIIIEAKTLRSLEIAEMFAHFGTKVTLVCDRKFFNQIEHLMFRDAIKLSLIDANITILEKKEIDSIDYHDTNLTVHLKSQSQLAFEIMENDSVDSVTADILVVEGKLTRNSFDKELEIFDDLAESTMKILYLSKPFVTLEKNKHVNDRVVRLDASQIPYFVLRYEEEGGLEVSVNPESNQITSASIYTHQAIDIGQCIELMMNQSLSLDTIKDVSPDSIFSVLLKVKESV
ncbi:MAG: hypothetical protein GXY98_03780 [Erysipelothrix sp.]|nr:hypothetical protein [Erysipelothrix sp.]